MTIDESKTFIQGCWDRWKAKSHNSRVSEYARAQLFRDQCLVAARHQFGTEGRWREFWPNGLDMPREFAERRPDQVGDRQ